MLNIGLIYSEQGDYPKALYYHNRSLRISEEIDDKLGMSISLHNIGECYIKEGDYIKALDFHIESLKISEEIDDKDGISRSLINIGASQAALGDFHKAHVSLQRALSIAEKIGYTEIITFTSYSICETYAVQGDFSKAIEYCHRSLDLAKEIGNVPVQKDTYKYLYKSYKAIGDNKKALNYHEQMLVLNDSLKTQETTKKLQQMEFAKQVLADSLLQVEKELQVEMAHQAEVRTKDRNRNLAIGAGIFFLVLSGGFYSRWRYVRKSKAIIEKEKDRSDNLLLNILPSEIAEELKEKGSVDAQDFDQVSVLFTDFKGFTTRSETLSAKELVSEINHCFKAFDHICGHYNIEKIKTIGDAYMAGGGLPVPSEDAVKNTVLAALEMQDFMEKRAIEKKANDEIPFEMRVGIHTGPVVAGIVGVKKFQYDIWGDTVNTASRVESSGEVGKVNISQATYDILKDDPDFIFEARGKISAKGKGEIEMFFVEQSA